MWNSACFIRCGFCCCLLSSVWLGEPSTVREGCYLFCRAHTSAAHGEEVSIQTTWLIEDMAHSALWVPLNMKRLHERPFAWISFEDTWIVLSITQSDIFYVFFFFNQRISIIYNSIHDVVNESSSFLNIYSNILWVLMFVSMFLLQIELDLWLLNL